MSWKGLFAPPFAPHSWTTCFCYKSLLSAVSSLPFCPLFCVLGGWFVWTLTAFFALWLPVGFNQWGAIAGIGGKEESEVRLLIPHLLSYMTHAGWLCPWTEGSWFLPGSPPRVRLSGTGSINYFNSLALGPRPQGWWQLLAVPNPWDAALSLWKWCFIKLYSNYLIWVLCFLLEVCLFFEMKVI